MGNAKAKFIKPMMAVLPAPKTDDLQTYVEVYAKMLDEFDDEVLELAADLMLRTIKVKSMPVPAECVDACWEAAETIRLRKLRASQPKRKIPEQFMWTEEMAKNADKLFASAWGRKAVADKVEVALWDFLVKNQRWPNGVEYDNLRAHSLAQQAETSAFLRLQKENGGINSSTKSFLGDLSKQSARLRELARVA